MNLTVFSKRTQNERSAYLILQIPYCGQSSVGISREAARLAITSLPWVSSDSGITATMRGAPSAPANTRVADARTSRFLSWACFALFRRFRRSWAAGPSPPPVLAGPWPTRPSEIYHQIVIRKVSLAPLSWLWNLRTFFSLF